MRPCGRGLHKGPRLTCERPKPLQRYLVAGQVDVNKTLARRRRKWSTSGMSRVRKRWEGRLCTSQLAQHLRPICFQTLHDASTAEPHLVGFERAAQCRGTRVLQPAPAQT